MNVRSIGRLIVVASVAMVTACGGADASTDPTTVPLPNELAACTPARPVTDPAACNDQLLAVLQERAQSQAAANGAAAQAAFTAVLPPLLERLQSAGGGFAFSVETPLADDPRTSTEPIRTRWVLSAEPLTVWACFAAGRVTVSRAACAAVP